MTTPKDRARNAARSKRARLQARALDGTLEPREWKVCAHCGECYPYFSPYLQHAEAQTCPSWLTGTDCGARFRVSRMVKAAALGKGKVKPFKSGKGYCRKELCNKAPFCANIDSCLDLDLEIENPGTLPLKADGSCKVPVIGLRDKDLRLRGASYGIGAAYHI